MAAESEGLDVIDARGGVLHWLLSPLAPGGAKPTYGTGHSELLTFVPTADARLDVRAGVSGTGKVHVIVRLRYSGGFHRVEGARVSAGGAHAITGRDGTADLRVHRAGTVRITARKAKLLAGHATLRVAPH